MKPNRYLLWLAIWSAFSCIPAFSQKGEWYWQTPKPTGLSVLAVDFADSLHGYTITNGGYVTFTHDGGRHWMLSEHLAIGGLTGISSPSAFTAFVCSSSGKIAMTVDGGFHWQTVFSGLERTLHDICTIDDMHIWAVGQDRFLGADKPYLVMSADGGQSWQEIFPPDYNTELWQKVQFFSKNRGIAMSTQAIWHSWDGGKTWPKKAPLLSQPELYNCAFLDSTYGWAWTHGTIYPTYVPRQMWRSTNGGLDWENWEFEDDYFFEMHFLDSMTGYSPRQNYILKTEDGGKRWYPWKTVEKNQHQRYGYVYRMAVHDHDKMWFFGNQGVYYRSLNASGSFPPGHIPTGGFWRQIFTEKNMPG